MANFFKDYKEKQKQNLKKYSVTQEEIETNKKMNWKAGLISFAAVAGIGAAVAFAVLKKRNTKNKKTKGAQSPLITGEGRLRVVGSSRPPQKPKFQT